MGFTMLKLELTSKPKISRTAMEVCFLPLYTISLTLLISHPNKLEQISLARESLPKKTYYIVSPLIYNNSKHTINISMKKLSNRCIPFMFTSIKGTLVIFKISNNRCYVLASCLLPGIYSLVCRPRTSDFRASDFLE